MFKSSKLDESKSPPWVELNYFADEETADNVGVFALLNAFEVTEYKT